MTRRHPLMRAVNRRIKAFKNHPQKNEQFILPNLVLSKGDGKRESFNSKISYKNRLISEGDLTILVKNKKSKQ